MLPNLLETADLVTFTEEILYGKLHFLCCDLLYVRAHFHDRMICNSKDKL